MATAKKTVAQYEYEETEDNHDDQYHSVENSYVGMLRAQIGAEHIMRIRAEARVQVLEERIARCMLLLSGADE